MKNKLTDVQKIGPLYRLRDPKKLKDGLVSLINMITDLLKLSNKHNIEQRLFNGEGLDIIYGLMGDYRVTKWLNEISDDELEDGPLWNRLIKFLEKELKIQQQKSLIGFKVKDSSDDLRRS